MGGYTFYKYQGAGNDFIVFDNRNGVFQRDNTDLVRHLCDRRFGVGGDGLMLLQDVDGHDFEMVYYNADGNEGSMCGNGGRCIVAFARDLGVIDRETDFLAADGAHYARVLDQADQISLQMIDVDQVGRDDDAYVIDTGSPHYVKVVDGLDAYPVVDEGRKIRYNNTYRSKGINVNFVEADTAGYFVRTYERGVEDETLACGTGATAVALAMALHEGLEGELETPIRMMGGKLNIRFCKKGKSFTQVFLEGPANFVFEGKVSW